MLCALWSALAIQPAKSAIGASRKYRLPKSAFGLNSDSDDEDKRAAQFCQPAPARTSRQSPLCTTYHLQA